MRKKHSVLARCYDRSGKLLSVAKNSYTKSHTIQAEYSRRVGRESAIYLHAEVAALLKARGDVYRMEIVRLQADGSSGIAKPCAGCQLAIEEFGVKEIIYTEP
jgi:deoxycytidylate deaminase